MRPTAPQILEQNSYETPENVSCFEQTPFFVAFQHPCWVYHGDSDNADEWLALHKVTASHDTTGGKGGLRSTSLGWEVGYEKIAEMCGGLGFLVRTEEELKKATEEGYNSGRVTVVNVVVEAGKGAKLEFGWQASGKKGKGISTVEIAFACFSIPHFYLRLSNDFVYVSRFGQSSYFKHPL